MRFYQLRNWLTNLLGLKKRLLAVCLWYLLSIMVETRKHSLNYAASLSGMNKSQFSKFLLNNHKITAVSLDSLSKKHAKTLSKTIQKFKSLPWSIAIIIDATLQERSSMKTQNVQKFNHGQGFVIGHQWTNIIIVINDVIIPLNPIPFYSKNYCRKNKIAYKTEHERIIDYLGELNLEEYIGTHRSQDVVVLADSGYDDKQIETAILKKGWNFIIALKNSRCVKSEAKYARTRKSSDWDQVKQFFKDQRQIKWETIRIITDSMKKKRLDYRIRHTTAYLKEVGKIQLVCSEYKKRPDGRRKYLACSDLKVLPRQIVIGYRLRWKIEIFHKQIKMHLGFEDIAVKNFQAVEAHVRLVYCAYILLHLLPQNVTKNAKTVIEKQQIIKAIIENNKIAHDLQMLTKIGGFEKFKNKLKSVLK